ncbi:helix-turn-helix transcriptional regulator [Ulvibacterium sp.]|uniref:helix-turn-helix transcriptional regulator n=1 Tax=Ulvibacterium sp. TaxID=2665914 RepID=UPI00345DAC8E
MKRLRKLLRYYDLSASAFADKIGVQRSSISHLLTGRNKPSLEFVLKVIDTFPEVDLYWLVRGKGNFPSTSVEKDILKAHTPSPVAKPQNIKKDNGPKTVDKVIVLYSHGSFEIYNRD